MVILGAALLWRAARLAYIAVREIPDVQAFVYLEGLCAIGQVQYRRDLNQTEEYTDLFFVCFVFDLG